MAFSLLNSDNIDSDTFGIPETEYDTHISTPPPEFTLIAMRSLAASREHPYRGQRGKV